MLGGGYSVAARLMDDIQQETPSIAIDGKQQRGVQVM